MGGIYGKVCEVGGEGWELLRGAPGSCAEGKESEVA